ncbi:hypothetical protein [Butyrivibrio sp. AE3009]|uniref:hypothetical protein n=1 Tax=Butyrivibrio sp. AE3009 TaxID=1280666 RepID=UPI0004160860|nr:hypothetical protein [Butyrivibrio sp. AE3009]
MAQQNIYDNDTFFEGYRKLRGNEGSANNLFEIPALFPYCRILLEKRYWIWAADLASIA